MNPIANTPVFVGLTANLAQSERKKTAFRAVLIAFIIIALFSFMGNIIFKLFGITLFAFKLASGVLLFFVGLICFRANNLRFIILGTRDGKSGSKCW